MPHTKKLLSITNLKKYFPVAKSSVFQKTQQYVRANEDISLDIYEGETIGVVGESGCGKSTLGRVLLRLTDTAGIRQSGDAVEQLGVARSRKAAEQASLALLLLDGSAPLEEQDQEAIALAETVPHLLVVVNKRDLPGRLDIGALADRFDNVLSVSAKTC